MNDEIKKIKDYIFDKTKRLLCNNDWWCGLEVYCPYYSCGALSKLSTFTDKQWENAIKKVRKMYKEISFEDLVNEVLLEMRYKRPRGQGEISR